METTGVPVFDHDGVPSGYRGMDRDVTERKRAAQALRERDERLRQSQKLGAIGQLAGGIAHDFNNLLTAIIGNSTLVLPTLPPDDPNRELIADIKETGERAAELTKQILAFSRRQALSPTMLHLNDIVADTETLLRRTIGEHIDLHIKLDPHLKAIEVDRLQMEQVIINLAVNARDAMPQGGTLTIETANVKRDPFDEGIPEVKPGPYVVLSVSDTGCGMNAETRSHAFEPFFTTKEVGKGTGLGLSMVFGIVEASGGSVSVRSEPGKGSTFRVYLPVSRAKTAPIADPSQRETQTLGKETILLVEDEIQVRELVARILSHSGYQVLQAGSADEASTVLEDGTKIPDLLLTDLILPGEAGGREVAKILQARYPNLAVVFMSGYARASVEYGESDNGVGILEKPFTPDALLSQIRRVLDSHDKGVTGTTESGRN